VVSHIEADGIVLKTKSGISKVYFVELPKEVQQRFGYDTTKPAELQKQQQAAERERKEKEKNAEADLKRVLEQFQVAEQRSAHTYQTAAKGTVSGHVFISTKGGENFKLGAVQVSLFARDAIDILIAGLKRYSDTKIQQVRPSVDAAKAAYEQGNAAEQAAFDVSLKSIGGGDYQSAKRAWDDAKQVAKAARDQFVKLSRELTYYYSGDFYFSYLHSPIQTGETDADGKFAVEVPQTGAFVVAAQDRRKILDDTEYYHWLQPVSLDGQQQRVQNLSNNNLTRTTGTSSVVLTHD
jgi:ribosomal protein L7/L12